MKYTVRTTARRASTRATCPATVGIGSHIYKTSEGWVCNACITAWSTLGGKA